jgi:hypothetical protein
LVASDLPAAGAAWDASRRWSAVTINGPFDLRADALDPPF